MNRELIYLTHILVSAPLFIYVGHDRGQGPQWLYYLVLAVGALVLYSIGKFFFQRLIKSILEKKFLRYIELFRKNEFYYFFIYRFIGGLGVPFGLQNLIPILFDMKKMNYFLASFFGFIPSMFIMNTIGAGLNSYVEQAQSFSMIDLILTPEIYFPIILFVGLMIVSFFVKKKFFGNAN